MILVRRAEKKVRFDNALWISFDYDESVVAKIKELPNRWYMPVYKAWEVPEEDLAILKAKLKDYNVKYAWEEEATDIKKAKSKREKVQKRLEGIKPIMEFPFKTKPFPHQIEGFNVGLEKDFLLLADEQGLGKTKQSIDIAVARKGKGVKKTLIICGVNSVKYNWEQEVKIHSTETAFVMDAEDIKKRIKQLEEWLENEDYFGVINIESLRKKELLAVLKTAIKKGVLGFIIVDEIHKAKNGQSLQGKALRELKPEYRMGLTGTPIMNRAEELWNILYWLGAETKNFWQFRGRYCIMGGYGGHKVVDYQNKEELNSKLNRIMLRRKKDEVLDLPPKIRSIEFIEMTEKQRQLYTEVRDGLIAEIDEIALNPNPLTSLLRLRQVTGGILGDDNPKLERLLEMVEEIVESGQKAVIFSNWKMETELLKKALKQYKPAYIVGEVEVADRQKEVKRFQEDAECKVAIGTIKAMGTGLTLTAGTYVIFMDKAWTPADNEQAEDRCHRIGTEGTVNVITMVAKNSIDEKIEEILLDKKELFEQIVEGNFEVRDKKKLLQQLLGIE